MVVLAIISLASFELMIWLSWCVEEDTSFSPFNTYFFSCKWRLSLLATLLSLFLVMFFLSTKFFSFFLTSFLYFFSNCFFIFSLNNHGWSISYKLTFTLFIASFHSLYFSIFLFYLFQHSQMFFFLASSICITSFLSLTFFFYFF